jgi:cytochrome c-type biogenesis protein CcmH
MCRLFMAVVCFVLTLSAPALAVQPDEILPDPKLEARARALSAGLRCLVCQNQSIDDSDAPLARDLRLLIRERLLAGDDDRAVESFIVDRYGEFVLLKPRLAMKTMVLWAGPFLVLLIASLFMLTRHRKAQAGDAEAPLSGDEKAAFGRLIKED